MPFFSESTAAKAPEYVSAPRYDPRAAMGRTFILYGVFYLEPNHDRNYESWGLKVLFLQAIPDTDKVNAYPGVLFNGGAYFLNQMKRFNEKELPLAAAFYENYDGKYYKSGDKVQYPLLLGDPGTADLEMCRKFMERYNNATYLEECVSAVVESGAKFFEMDLSPIEALPPPVQDGFTALPLGPEAEDFPF